MLEQFEIAGGSIPGRDHVGRGGLLFGRNNQDGHGWTNGPDYLVATVCDGCGGEPSSEFGAKAGVSIVPKAVIEELRLGEIASHPERLDDDFWERVRTRSLDAIEQMALLLTAPGESATQKALHHLTFTVLGTLITPQITAVFSVGDGLYAVNGEIYDLGPFPNNEPPYLIFGHIPSTRVEERLTHFQVRTFPTQEVNSLLLSTDGGRDFVEAKDRPIPGQSQAVGPLSQFWEVDLFFNNRDTVRRRLALVNSKVNRWDGKRLVTQGGSLRDDTTVVVIRRKAQKPS